MKKIALKLVKLFGLTSLERTTKLECSIKELENFKAFAIERFKATGEKFDEIIDEQTEIEIRVQELETPYHSIHIDDRLTVMHESEDTAAWQLKNSPFVIAREKEEYYVLCGSYRLNDEGFKTVKEAIKDADRDDWQRKLVMIQMLIENNNEMMSRPQRRKLIKK